MKSKLDLIYETLKEVNYNYGSFGRKLKSKDPQFYQEILDYWDKICPNNRASFLEKVYCYIKGYNPICPRGNKRSYFSFEKGYYTGCGKQCPCAQEKKKQSIKENHGVESPLQSEELMNKAKNTWKEKYGVENLHEVNLEQKKETNKRKYGVENPLQSKEFLHKIKKSYKEKTGYDKPFQNPEIKEKVQNTFLRKYGKKGFSKTYMTEEQKRKEQEKRLIKSFGEEVTRILLDKDKFEEELNKSGGAKALSKKLNCSESLINKRVKEFDIKEFRKSPSYYEVVIEKWLNEHGIEHIRNDRKIISPKELDFYIPEYNLAIEFNGLSWHGELNGIDRNYHLNKTSKCLEQGIQLIHIFQDEMDNYSDTVFSILGNYLNLNLNKIYYARNCSIQKISNKEAEKFHEEHHLQGSIKGCFINYGLYHSDELLMVISFKKDNQGNIELTRLTNKPFVKIIGGGSRLFNRFLKENEYVEKVVTFTDRRYFTGKIYEQLGFEYSHTTKPNYFYFNKTCERWHRFNFRKSVLIKEGYDSSKSEWEIMQEKGYDRIWDCGNIKWIWKNK